MANEQSPSRPANWNSNRRGPVPKYVYKTLKELNASNNSKEFYNLYGVIIDGRGADKSKGSDFFCILRIVDPSFCHGEGVKVTLFHQDKNCLPEVNQWDIIRLHRVRTNSFQTNLSLMNAKGWSWVSWAGKTEDNVEESVKSGSASCTIVDEDKNRVLSLRKWIERQGYSDLNVFRNAKNGVDQKLAEIKSGAFFNLACQVTGIAKIRNDFIILKVWDGTIPSHKIEPGVYSEDCEIQILANIDGIQQYMVDVSVFDNHVHVIDDDQIELGSFVRFYNLHASSKIVDYNSPPPPSSEECSELFLHGGTAFNRGFVLLEEDSDVVSQLKDVMMEILNANQKFDSTENSLSEKNKNSPEKRQVLHSPVTKRRKLHKSTERSPAASTESETDFSTPPQQIEKALLGTQSLLLQDTEPGAANSEEQSQDTFNILLGINSQKQQVQDAGCSQEAEQSEATSQPPQSPAKRRDIGVQAGDPQTVRPIYSSTPENHAESSNGVELLVPESDIMTSQEMRCNQKFSTVVLGECSSLPLNSISELLRANVPLQESRLFRVVVKVCRCSDLNSIVCHFCPVTGIRLPARNDGQAIELPDDGFQYFSSWRQNYFIDVAPSSGEGIESLSVINTQWPVVTGSGNEGDHIDIDMETYECEKDGSKWETLKFKSNISRKRKMNRKRFNILYHEDQECSINLKTVGKNFQRVYRVCSKESLISQNIPAAAFQDGLFYYCSPACVGKVAIPTLEQEANNFDPKKPRFALGCPLMPIQFHFKMLLEDQSDVLEVALNGQNAVSFLNEVTPAQYLLDTNGCRTSISEHISKLTNDEDTILAEMIIEKKSRRPLPGNCSPVLLYEIVKTRLAL